MVSRNKYSTSVAPREAPASPANRRTVRGELQCAGQPKPHQLEADPETTKDTSWGTTFML